MSTGPAGAARTAPARSVVSTVCHDDRRRARWAATRAAISASVTAAVAT